MYILRAEIIFGRYFGMGETIDHLGELWGENRLYNWTRNIFSFVLACSAGSYSTCKSEINTWRKNIRNTVTRLKGSNAPLCAVYSYY
jgi:hypothetical protein